MGVDLPLQQRPFGVDRGGVLVDDRRRDFRWQLEFLRRAVGGDEASFRRRPNAESRADVEVAGGFAARRDDVGREPGQEACRSGAAGEFGAERYQRFAAGVELEHLVLSGVQIRREPVMPSMT